MTEAERRIYIGELAEMVDRRVNTVRQWERSGRLPEHLRSIRADTDSGHGWRHWTPEQVAEICKWMKKERLYPGAGLANFDPDPARVEEMLAALRSKKGAPA